MEGELKEKTVEFIKAFEEVFHNDWGYTKEMLGIYDQTEEQKASDKEMGLETIDIISERGTFFKPDVDDETQDWGNRGHLLKTYRLLKESLSS